MGKIVVKIISQEDVAEIFKGNSDALFSVIDAERLLSHAVLLL